MTSGCSVVNLSSRPKGEILWAETRFLAALEMTVFPRLLRETTVIFHSVHHTQRGRNMEKKVLAAMKKAGKPVRPGDVAKMIGAESKEVSQVMDALKKAGKIKSPKRCFYEPA